MISVLHTHDSLILIERQYPPKFPEGSVQHKKLYNRKNKSHARFDEPDMGFCFVEKRSSPSGRAAPQSGAPQLRLRAARRRALPPRELTNPAKFIIIEAMYVTSAARTGAGFSTPCRQKCLQGVFNQPIDHDEGGIQP